MIWVTDREGDVVYVSPEWSVISGMPREAAIGEGWQAAVHADDLPVIVPVFKAALRAKSEVTLQFRMRMLGEHYAWVISGAVPSIDPEGDFIGYLGSLTKIEAHSLTPVRACGRLGSFDPPAPHALTMTNTVLGQVADHLLIAHSLIVEHDVGAAILPALKRAMFDAVIAFSQGSDAEARH